MNEETIFAEALGRKGEARAAFLDKHCKGNIELRKRLEALLRADDNPDPFLDVPAPVGPTMDAPMRDFAGTLIGPYKLLQQIGEGGMGVVWMAEQTEPVKRKVALKVIKPGMDSRQVIARFEAERQALAMMDHVNIARVFDGGTTGECSGSRQTSGSATGSAGTLASSATGRPYFVMELVHGVPITKYCDDNHLTPRERLELFVPVCQAIQHAHQKGIIHRDIKPSNVMVTLYDGKPVPKVIDFGVAKATEQKLTERTLFTQYGTMVGTLEYMSPEQAEMSALGVDTRSDIYSLGVLLYELLTGSTPLTRQRMKEAAYAEILRMIKEEEPPRPSTRLSDSGEALASISAQRHMEPAKLTKLVKGELDWIVMKTLEKDRNRRYETANAFAMDVQRYLDDETVQACPPSAAYRFRKFVRRNKAALAFTGLVLFFLMLLGSGVGWAVRDRSAREAEAAQQQVARQGKVAEQVESILIEVERLEKEQKWPEALAAARRAEAAVAGGEADPETTERVRGRVKDLEFLDRLERIRMERATTMADGWFDYAGADKEYRRAFRDYGVDVEELVIETSIDRLRARAAFAIPMAAALDDWVYARRRVSGRNWKRLVAIARGIDPEPLRDRARATLGQPVSEVQDELRQLIDSIDVRRQHPATLHLLATLGGVRDSEAARHLLRNAQEAYPGDFWLNYDLGHELAPQDREGAIRFYTAAMSLRPNSAAAHNNLGSVLRQYGKLEEANRQCRKAIELQPNVPHFHRCLGNVLQYQKKLDEAIACYNRAIELDPKSAGPYNDLGTVLFSQSKVDQAIACLKKAIELDPNDAAPHLNLGAPLRARNKLDEAIAHYRKSIALRARDPSVLAGTYVELGLALNVQKKPDEALEALRKAVEINPKDATAQNALGALLCNDRKDYGKGAECFRKAIEINPKFAQYWVHLGHALVSQGKHDDAIAAYRRAIEIDPNSQFAAEAYFRIGKILEGQGKLDETIACFRKAAEHDPNYAIAHSCLAWLLTNCREAKFRDASAGLDAARKAVKVAPQSSLAWQVLGWAHYRGGDWKASFEALEKSCALDDDPKGGNALQWFFLAMAHWKLGEKDKAREWYDKGVQWMDKNDPKSEDLRRFRAEAATLLELNEK